MEFEGLNQSLANYVPLSPISFLERASFVYENCVSIVYNDTKYTWRETRDRCVRLASALSVLGLNRQEVVVVLAPNIPALYELHFGVPMAGAVLSALNTRLDSSTLATNLHQLEAKFVFVDYQYIEIVVEALKVLSQTQIALPRLVIISKNDEPNSQFITKLPHGSIDYNELILIGKSNFNIMCPYNECDPISINYTSGSTGKPKGVVYSHRAAYLNSLAVIFRYDMSKTPIFLWTVDMFRCNGWCFPWAIAALGGTNICSREVIVKEIFDSIVIHKVTHLFGAPTILEKIANSESNDQREISTNVDIIVAGRLPPKEILSKIKILGFNIGHAYGMTEALGPMMVRSLAPKCEATSLDNDEHERVKHREGTHSIFMEDVDVKDPETMTSVPRDGRTIGEVMFRGNVLMSGYLKNMEQTQDAFKCGWYRTGDLGTKNPNGYIEMKDRASDSIIMKGEIVSTIEIERTIMSHPMVKEVAIVGKPNIVLGESPCAFLALKEKCFVSDDEIIKFCEEKLSRNMVPIKFYFGSLPMNSTGKVQKFILREKAKAMGSLVCINKH